MVDFIGICDLKEERLELVQKKTQADYATTDFRKLLERPEITAVIIATDEHLHVEPILAAVERGIPMLIEKPLATELAESERVLQAIQKKKVDAVVGYTQRFRRRWLVAKEKVRTGSLGDVTLVTSRAFMNRLVALDNYKRTSDPSKISPMVTLGRQGARADLQGHRRYRRPDHVRGWQPLSCVDLVGAAGGVAGRGVQPGSRHQRHRGRAHHRRHAPGHCFGNQPFSG
jgi:hypothetical protein